jgi:hypothetical protein
MELRGMANLKIFISSTCYDMHAIRAQLRSMLIGVGYEPVMSDQADVIYDPRIHTHTSCLREVENCDAVVVVIGSRFGGSTIPKALELVDMDRISDLSRSDRFGEDKTKISITQAEVIKAIQTGIPIFAFVDSGVMRDHLTYEKNKNKPIIGQIEFSSIDKSDTASYIFEFINFLRLRNENNSIFEFSRFEDIESQLKKQWAGLFQRLLHEQRTKALEGRRIDNLSSQIADLKAAVLGSISSGELKETAKGAIRFRQFIEFVTGLARGERSAAASYLLRSDLTWNELMRSLGVVEVRQNALRGRYGPTSVALLLDDQTYFRCRASMRVISRFDGEWSDFRGLSNEAKNAILDAVFDSLDGRVIPMLVHYDEPFTENDGPLADDDAEAERTRAPASILLTKEKFLEESIKNYLVSNPSFQNMKFMVDVNSDRVNIARIPDSTSGSTKVLEYEYKTPEDGNLSGELERLKSEISRGIVQPEEKAEKNTIE